MNYIGSEEQVGYFLKKWKRWFYLQYCFAILIFIMLNGEGIQKEGLRLFLPLIAQFLVLIYSFVFFLKGVKFCNKVIVNLEIGSDRMVFSTLSPGVFGGLIKKEGIRDSFSRDPIGIMVRKSFYSSHGGTVAKLYLLSQGNKKYFIDDRFFGDFPAMREELEKFAGQLLPELGIPGADESVQCISAGRAGRRGFLFGGSEVAKL